MAGSKLLYGNRWCDTKRRFITPSCNDGKWNPSAVGKGVEHEVAWADHAGYTWCLLVVGEVEDEVAGFASGPVGIQGYVEDGAFVSCGCTRPAVG